MGGWWANEILVSEAVQDGRIVVGDFEDHGPSTQSIVPYVLFAIISTQEVIPCVFLVIVHAVDDRMKVDAFASASGIHGYGH